jgi:AhpD family alkylhydroperoxidase
MDSRIEPGRLRELGLVNWAFSRVAARVVGVPDAHIFSTLGRTRGLFRGWLHYSARLMPFGSLSRADAEMVILRVAHLRGCEYELDHHKRLGRRAGLSDADIERVFTGPAAWDGGRRALLAAVDELVETRDIGDAAWTELAKHRSDRELIEIVMLVGQYDSLATTLSVLRVQRDFA